jgi:outer membrane protein assembly factor BamA
LRAALWLALILAFAPRIGVAQTSDDAAKSPTGAEAPPLIVEDLQCRGNVATACDFILRHVYLGPGDRIDEIELQNAKLRLSALPNFRSVDIYLQKGAARGQAVVIVEVVEGDAIVGELAIGTSARFYSVSQIVAGRVSYQNLFGTGKILDLTVAGRIPLAEITQKGVFAEVRYIDPQLFGSQRYYFTAGVSYEDAFFGESSTDPIVDSRLLGLNLSVGRRLWDFSYVSLGYQNRPLIERVVRKRKDGIDRLETIDDTAIGGIFFGWNTEDDPHFPTLGSALSVGFSGWTWNGNSGNDENALTLQYRRTWRSEDNAFWSFRFGGAPNAEYRSALGEELGIGFQYARQLRGENLFGARRGRWYVEAGGGYLYYTPEDGFEMEVAIKAGVRFDTQSFGVVNLFVIGSAAWDPGGRGDRQ